MGGAGSVPTGSSQDEEVAKLGLTVSRAYTPGGIVINYSSDKLLNYYDEEAHALMLIVYQMENINAFNKLAKDSLGIQRLLAYESFDKSVTGLDRFFIEPGEKSQLVIDRAENTKWIGIVAGYYNIVPAQMVRTYEIPIMFQKEGVYGFRKTTVKTTMLSVSLYLGSNSIQEVKNP